MIGWPYVRSSPITPTERMSAASTAKALPDVALEAGGGDLAADDGIGLLQHAHALGRHLAEDRTARPGPGNGCRQTIDSGRPSSSPSGGPRP